MLLTRRATLRGAVGFAALAAAGCASGPLIVSGDPVALSTRNGELEGLVDADGVRSFKGVPYAVAPVGEWRFRPPEPPAPWTGVRSARRFAPMAMQSADGEKSEDCLALNIWTPASPGPHPVYVWVHAGGNIQGRANDPRYDGASFARNGVVVVTITHRVGVWGFLELGEVLGPQFAGSGNNGLRDIVAALAWVRDNIADFGGDSGRVTLGGLSSGAKNTCALMSVESAQGLFQSACIESGGGQTVHTLDEAHAIAERFMTMRQLRGRPSSVLQTASAERLLTAQETLAEEYENPFPFRAIVDGSYLAQLPLDAIAAGAGRDVRVLMGGTGDEAALLLDGRTGDDPIEQAELAHITLAEAEPLYARYQEIYRAESPLDRRLKFVSAEEYWVPTMRVADARAGLAGAETYLYRFDWKSRGGPFAGRAQHGAQVPYIWNNLEPPVRAGAPAAPLAMHDMWVQFIKGGVPDRPEGPAWPRYAADDRRLMAFEADMRAIAPDDAQLALWDGLL